jgi:hypothetical protein
MINDLNFSLFLSAIRLVFAKLIPQWWETDVGCKHTEPHEIIENERNS